jgi:malate/lactate dehydrogenase
MNKQIEKLADEAGLGMLTNPDDTWAKYLEKFVELIVEECAEIADNPDVDMLRVGKAIKHHFGVKE